MRKYEIPVSFERKLSRMSKRKKKILKDISNEDIRLVYTFDRYLGSGSFGTVRLAHKTTNPGVHFAVKSVKR